MKQTEPINFKAIVDIKAIIKEFEPGEKPFMMDHIFSHVEIQNEDSVIDQCQIAALKQKREYFPNPVQEEFINQGPASADGTIPT